LASAATIASWALTVQAQYRARDIEEACHILLQHYEHTYIAPGERFPRRAHTNDPIERNVQLYPHRNGHENGFTLVGEIFSDETNPARKKPFDIRKVMMAAVDQDHLPLERWRACVAPKPPWFGMPISADIPCASSALNLARFALGIHARPTPGKLDLRHSLPALVEENRTAINAASNNRPVVFLANLSGFDGSPESMRKLQLEYGAESGAPSLTSRAPWSFAYLPLSRRSLCGLLPGAE